MARQRATFTVDTVVVTCPGCGVPVAEPVSGSQFWTIEEVQARPDTRCGNCFVEFSLQLPKRINVR